MSVNVETLEKNLVKLTVEVPVEDVEKSIEKVYQKEKNQDSAARFPQGQGAPQDDREDVWR